jgi:chemotaxis protein CheZ
MHSEEFSLRWGVRLAMLNHAYAACDVDAFDAALDALNEGRPGPAADIARLSDTLRVAVARFHSDSRLAVLAHREVPDASLRLDHVVQMTQEAAHRTLDLIERSAPLASASLQGANQLLSSLDAMSTSDVRAYLEELRGNVEALRANLSEVILAQSYQDLAGQILRGVQRLVCEVQGALAQYAHLTGSRLVDETQRSVTLSGPAVPGVTRGAAAGQADVDDLMAGLGL